MMLFNSALLTMAGLFVGPYAPYQSIHIQPHDGGVLVASSNIGRITFLGFDRQGSADESCDLIPDKDLLDACTGIKTAERDVLIEGATARVTTYRKTTGNDVKEFNVLHSTTPFPPLRDAVRACIDHWSVTPELSRTAGRYATTYLTKAIKAAGLHADSVVLSSFDGGPLRLQSGSLEMLILVMPQTAEPIPRLPDWVCSFAGFPPGDPALIGQPATGA